MTAPWLGSEAIKNALEKAKVPASAIEDVMMGCVLQGNIGQAPARQAAIMAGLNKSTPCTTVNKVCASGMKAMMLSAANLSLGLHVGYNHYPGNLWGDNGSLLHRM